MKVESGSLLGPYEVVSRLGEGGMGEVWRAKDPRLGREVAVKVLPASFSKEPERLRRFEQEARAAGALNHPNVTAVHDFGSHEGAPYIVTELLEGETLRARLSGGAIAPRKAIDYAVQIARGLAAAHQKGIVHRDLKPENLFLTNDGRVKILDFGLAKLAEGDGAGEPSTNLPTASGTDPGVVMGTLGYMSPEQVKGKPADGRSDIFAFGAVLYEMLSGTRAFRRDSAAETMSAILREDPPDLTATNRGVPPGLDRIVRHCLEKNPEERTHSAHDLAFDLESFSTASSGPATLPGTRAMRLPRPGALVVAAASLGAGLLAGGLLLRPAPHAEPTFHRLTFRRGNVLRARFAPDGRTIVYGAAWSGAPAEVFTVRVEGPESRPLGLPNATVASVSSAGELAILSSPGMTDNSSWATLSRVPLSGGAPRALLEEVTDADWTPDGRELAVVRTREGGGRRLELPAGKTLYETPRPIGALRVSRDGSSVAFVETGEKGATLLAVDRAGKVRTLAGPMTVFSGRFAWSASGREVLYWGGRDLRDAALRAADLAGRVRTLYRATGYLFVHDVFPDGRMLVEQANSVRGLMFARTGDRTETEFSWFDRSSIRAVAAGGGAILFNEIGEAMGGRPQAFYRKTDGSPAIRLADGEGLALSPDGSRVLLRSDEGLAVVPVGAGTPAPLALGPVAEVASASFFPDGRRILLDGSEKGKLRRFWVVDPPALPRAIAPEGFRGSDFSLSPDGRTVLCWSGDTSVLSLLPVGGGPIRALAGTEHDDPVGWTADSRSLYARRSPSGARQLFTLDLGTLERRPWKELSPPDAASVTSVPVVAFAPDGSGYAYTFQRVLSSDLYVVEGLR